MPDAVSDAHETWGNETDSAGAEPRRVRKTGSSVSNYVLTSAGLGESMSGHTNNHGFGLSRWPHSGLCSDVTSSERPSLTAPSGLLPPHSLHTPTFSPQHLPSPAPITVCPIRRDCPPRGQATLTTASPPQCQEPSGWRRM